jgi:aldose 1-epimerase
MDRFGTLPDGRVVDRHRLQSAGGVVVVDILTMGGVIQKVFAPDRAGQVADVALGFADLDSYLHHNRSHLGAIVGRCANRIADGKITIDGVSYLLSRNRGRDTLHGGNDGFHRALWTVEEAAADRLCLSLESPDGDQGFPGTLSVQARYSLSADNALRLDFEAITNKPTVVNLSSHAYWNLAGDGAGEVLDQLLEVDAASFTPLSERMLPTGDLHPVEGTPFDFRYPRPLREAVTRTSDPQIVLAGGLDHNFVLRGGPERGLAPAARLSDQVSGRVLQVWTTEPGLQVYTGNHLEGGAPGKTGTPYRNWEGVALEPQHFPDAPHRPSFPSILLRPGEVYRSSTVFKFGTDDAA